MYYSKKERNKIYKNAYKIIKDGLEHFACVAIQQAIQSRIFVDENEFPELFLFKDRENHYTFLSDKGFDANTDDFTHKKMITRKLWVLAFCIAMTE